MQVPNLMNRVDRFDRVIARAGSLLLLAAMPVTAVLFLLPAL
jgi:hypothetical protein